MQSAVERWHELIDMRAWQMDAAYARLGRTSSDFWDRRAKNYHRSTRESIADDPLFLRLSSRITGQTTMLDVGAGTGRFTIALAPLVKEIVAVEPNSSMLGFLRQDTIQQHLTNVSFVQSTWQEAPDDLQADVAICSHVLYPIREIDAFLAKLLNATRERCFIYMWATHLDGLTAHLWRHFHGEERHLPPTYIHALDVLYEMEWYANVEIVNVLPFTHYASLEKAVDEMLERLILPNDTASREELRSLLANWLVERNGVWVSPVETLTCAIIEVKR